MPRFLLGMFGNVRTRVMQAPTHALSDAGVCRAQSAVEEGKWRLKFLSAIRPFS